MVMKSTKWVVRDKKRKDVFWPSDAMKRNAWVSGPGIYKEGEKDPVAFWEKLAREGLDWEKEWKKGYKQDRTKLGTHKWFLGGRINASYNTLDRHVKAGRGDRTALIWAPEIVKEKTKRFTYSDLHRDVNRFASALKRMGVRKGDKVGIYMPMIPEVIIAMLSCARIGAIHSVVFSAFSGESLNDRLLDAGAKVLITADGYYRRGKAKNLKQSADIGVKGTHVRHVVVVKRTGLKIPWNKTRDRWFHEVMKKSPENCEPEFVESNETLFILYTSGTTGKPKGVIHDTGGYLTQAYWTTKLDFDLHDGSDVFWCTADVGWVTGHTYGCYGPLSVGATMLMFDGAPEGGGRSYRKTRSRSSTPPPQLSECS